MTGTGPVDVALHVKLCITHFNQILPYGADDRSSMHREIIFSVYQGEPPRPAACASPLTSHRVQRAAVLPAGGRPLVC